MPVSRDSIKFRISVGNITGARPDCKAMVRAVLCPLLTSQLLSYREMQVCFRTFAKWLPPQIRTHIATISAFVRM